MAGDGDAYESSPGYDEYPVGPVGLVGSRAAEDEPLVEGALEDALARHLAGCWHAPGRRRRIPRSQPSISWLIDYHNWVCSQFLDLPEALIDSDQPPPAIRLLGEC